jgi:excisionase family DNA binding protein
VTLGNRAVLTVPEAAGVLGVSPRTYYAAAARGEVPVVRIGRRLVVPTTALARFLEGGETNGKINHTPEPPAGL